MSPLLKRALKSAAAPPQKPHRHQHAIRRVSDRRRAGICVCGRAVWRHFGTRNEFIGCMGLRVAAELGG